MIRFCDIIDATSRFVTDRIAWLFIPMTLIAVYEVGMRYLFNSPTIWAWDVNVQLFSLVVVFGSANTFLNDGHVRMDLIITRFNPKTAQKISLVLYLFLIFVIGVLVWQTGLFAYRSVLIGERTSTLLAAPIYPLKIAICVGVITMLLQVISMFLRTVHSAIKDRATIQDQNKDS